MAEAEIEYLGKSVSLAAFRVMAVSRGWMVRDGPNYFPADGVHIDGLDEPILAPTGPGSFDPEMHWNVALSGAIAANDRNEHAQTDGQGNPLPVRDRTVTGNDFKDNGTPAVERATVRRIGSNALVDEDTVVDRIRVWQAASLA